MPPEVMLSAMERWTRWLVRGLDAEVAVVWPVYTGHDRDAGEAQLLSLGGLAAVRLRPKDVFGPALRVNADAVAIAHTHLRDVGPSEPDHAVTRRLVAAGVILGMPLVAHLVVEPSCAYELVTGRLLTRRAAAA